MTIKPSILIGAATLRFTGGAIVAGAEVVRVKVDSSRHWKGHHFAMTNWFYKHKWNFRGTAS